MKFREKSNVFLYTLCVCVGGARVWKRNDVCTLRHNCDWEWSRM